MDFFVIFPIFAANYGQTCYHYRRRNPHGGCRKGGVFFVMYKY